MCSAQVQHMQKALELMNLKLTNVISDIRSDRHAYHQRHRQRQRDASGGTSRYAPRVKSVNLLRAITTEHLFVYASLRAIAM